MKIDISTSIFNKMGANSNKLSRKGIMRIGKELCVFQKSLPLSLSSSVFLRTDDSKSHIMQFIITGPEQTPYSNGCFLFNLVIPSNFPNDPPKCLLVTTGGGTVRFNPNLYNCGKVCLSLLGTWSGSGGEKWNSETSTLLQLLVSIQSLILVPDPYFNEPGYENNIHSEYGINQNKSYNDNIRLRNMQWAILDQLKNPSPGFEDAIKTHFLIKKDIILKECKQWVDECIVNKNVYNATYENIKIELDNLKNSYKDKLNN
jgi:baculoviral IAP repeat-containing protein 6